MSQTTGWRHNWGYVTAISRWERSQNSRGQAVVLIALQIATLDAWKQMLSEAEYRPLVREGQGFVSVKADRLKFMPCPSISKGE